MGRVTRLIHWVALFDVIWVEMNVRWNEMVGEDRNCEVHEMG
jgi:hypothetical protein